MNLIKKLVLTSALVATPALFAQHLPGMQTTAHASAIMYINVKGGVDVKATYDSNAKTVGHWSYGQAVRFTKSTFATNGDRWVYAKLNGVTGWVNMKDITDEELDDGTGSINDIFISKNGIKHYVSDAPIAMKSEPKASSKSLYTLKRGYAIRIQKLRNVGNEKWGYGESKGVVGWVNMADLQDTPVDDSKPSLDPNEDMKDPNVTGNEDNRPTPVKETGLYYINQDIVHTYTDFGNGYYVTSYKLNKAFRVQKSVTYKGIDWVYGEASGERGWLKRSYLSKNKTTPKETIHVKNEKKNITPVRTLPAKASESLQGFVYGKNDEIYATYATGNKWNTGYVYHMNKNGKVLSKSKKITIGHGQGLNYKNGYIYNLADVNGYLNYEKPFKVYKRDPKKNYKIVKTFTLPLSMRSHVLYVHSDTKMASAKKYVKKNGETGYKISEYAVNKDGSMRESNTYRLPNAIVGNRSDALQSMTYHNGEYYLLTDGYYTKFNPKTKTRTTVNINTKRESEGIAVNRKGQLHIALNNPNQILKVK